MLRPALLPFAEEFGDVTERRKFSTKQAVDPFIRRGRVQAPWRRPSKLPPVTLRRNFEFAVKDLVCRAIGISLRRPSRKPVSSSVEQTDFQLR